ncbi:hypothetical protein GCM10009546_29120 [Actinomadura livida]|uniref:AraC family transcriptional regulator n=1 Tax=Actinomadura livida TaxID=79909 RepID=A0ABN1EET2_9ACTN|nr:hypothetical protein GCM10010208_34060 [Actinomadura livida]
MGPYGRVDADSRRTGRRPAGIGPGIARARSSRLASGNGTGPEAARQGGGFR